jgi:hypothetical protein
MRRKFTVLVDGRFTARPRKLLMQASRNWLFLRALIDERQESADHTVRRCELGKGSTKTGADSRSEEGAVPRPAC